MSSRSRRSRSPRFKRRRQSTVAEPTGLEDRPPGSTSTSPSRFDQLLELIKTQNGLISEQKEEIKAELQAQLQTMNKHTTMLKTLETDATKDDKAHEGRALGDAQTWHALDKETLAKIKVMVEEWRDVMQISLVFIALFLTVVTAFISPVIQLFTTPPDTSSAKAPPPSVPTQLVALFYYLALITSISNSVLCVLGIQWGARLIATPLGKTNLERALARERRMLSAEGKMRLLMGVLVWTLLISIAFFVLGFLIQLWELSFSFGGSAPILVVGGGIATGLSLIILGIILVTTLHAATTENSPFESPLSNALTPFLRWIRRRVRRPGHGATDLAKRKDRSGDTHSTGDTKDLASVIQWQKDDRPDVVALKTYAKLVLNTNDVEILERAVPSFEFGQWYDAGDRLLPVFHAVRERFLATDTSFRVKETVHKQLAYLKTWKGWREQEGVWRTNLKANDFTRWCQAQCLELIDRSRGSRREFFPPLAFLNSFEEDNMDLRHLGRRSNEQCVARILCTFDSDDELGDRVPIFRCAVEACNRLLRDGGTDQVTAILSHVERASVLRSFVRNPYMRSRTLANLVAFITKGNETEILNELSDFFSDLPEMSVVSDDDQHPLPVCSLLEHLLPSSLSDIIVPPSLDLSPLLGLVNQHSLYEWSSRTLTHYLNQGGFDKLSDLHPALKLWEFCRDVHDRYETSSEVVAFYEEYAHCFIPLPQLSSDECDDLAHNICALIARRDDWNIPIKTFKGPILELLDLDNERQNGVLARILSEARRSDFVDLMIKRSGLPWTRVQDLVLSIAKDHELEILNAVTNFDPFHFTNHTMSVFLDFLGGLVPSLPSDFTVPPSFHLSGIMFLIACRERRLQTWRRHADTIIAYFDHGASHKIRFDHLRYAARFLDVCISESPKMKKWDDDKRTSDHTRQRAMFYREELKARAAQDPTYHWLRPYFPEVYDPPSSTVTDEHQLPEKAVLTSSLRKWLNPFRKASRRMTLPENELDMELGTIRRSDVDESENQQAEGTQFRRHGP